MAATPTFLFSDALGSVVASISNTANSAVVKGNQVYGPYGNNPYSQGTMGTAKGYRGQYNDAFTQLDYYGARYYDPFVGIFLSADKVLGNLRRSMIKRFQGAYSPNSVVHSCFERSLHCWNASLRCWSKAARSQLLMCMKWAMTLS